MQTLNFLQSLLPGIFLPEKIEKKTSKPLNIDSIEKGEIAFCYGVSEKAFRLFSKRFKKPKTKLIFIEDCFGSLIEFAEKEEGRKILSHPRVSLHYVKSSFDLEEILKKELWQHLLETSFLMQTKEHPFLASLFSFLREGVHFTFSDYSDFGQKVLENVLQNLHSLQKLNLLGDLKGAFQGVPAFIVGAGPSLDEDAHLIDREKAIVFAGGSAVAALSKKGIKPHFVSTVDKDAPKSIFAQADFSSTAFLFQLRTNPENVQLAHEPKILAPSNGGYPLEDWITEKLGIYEQPLDFGWNVSTFLAQVAHYLGCGPIILIGQDLAHSSSQSYAEDLQVRKENTSFVKVQDRFGKEAMSQRDWVFARDWFCTFAKKPGVELLNATSKGLGFEGVKEFSSLEEPKQNIEEIVQSGLAKMTTKRMDLSHLQLAKSSRQMKNLVKDKIIELQKYYEAKHPIPKAFFASLEKEVFYAKHIACMWNLFSPTILAKGDGGVYTTCLQRLLFIEHLCSMIAEDKWREL